MRALFLIVVAALASSCISVEEPPPLAVAQSAPDLGTYKLSRVGLMPFAGEGLTRGHAVTLQDAFLLELTGVSRFELVRLAEADLAEVRSSDPYRRGSYEPRTLLELSSRYRLDAILIATVTQVNMYPPQVLAIGVDLVSCETGMVIWTANVRADASDAHARMRINDFRRTRATEDGWDAGADLTLISPSLFARFTASEVARTF